jgi:iron complex transport system substrate-binding protein
MKAQIQKSKLATYKLVTLYLIIQSLCILIIQEVNAAPHRIISTSPAITEILFAIGAGDRVVGVTDYCNFPKKACLLPSIGGPLNPSTEKWIALKPDLIILQDDSVVLNKHAKVFKIPTLEVSVNNLENILISIQVIADAMQAPKAGKQLVDKIKIQIDNYRTSIKKAKPRHVLMLLSDTNDPSRDLYAVGRNTFLNELLSIAGGENILPDTMATYPKISKEFIIAKSPEIIIEIGPTANLSNEGILNRKKAWTIYPTINAVRNDRLYFVGADYILIPGPRLVKILDILTRNIHPKLFSSTSNINQEIISR